MKDTLLSNYDFSLPEELIAQRPISPRDESRLLVYEQEKDQIHHALFKDLALFLPEDSELILNQSKVFPCRLLGKKSSGGRAEIFLLSLNPSKGGYPCLIRSSGKKRIGDEFFFEQGLCAKVLEIGEKGTFYVSFTGDLESSLEEFGKIPIPPYIRNGDSDDQDLDDYQTLYAKELGSVAAPTAGLHFTPRVFESLKVKNITKSAVTLHVGLGTFAPIKVDNISEHSMHSENYCIEEEEWQRMQKASFKTVVGTTTLRALESFRRLETQQTDQLHETDIFLSPGSEVQSCDALITNFHLPQSTLLMLVSSLIGREKTLELYQQAIEKKYRFFSYGDAMLILRGRQ